MLDNLAPEMLLKQTADAVLGLAAAPANTPQLPGKEKGHQRSSTPKAARFLELRTLTRSHVGRIVPGVYAPGLAKHAKHVPPNSAAIRVKEEV